MYGIILAGGSGSRLWPLSRELYPKHLLSITQDESLLQSTFNRLRSFIDEKSILTITSVNHATDVYIQLSKKTQTCQILSEPMSQNTAPAIVCALQYLKQKTNKDEVVAIVPSDHLIQDLQGFKNTLKEAEAVAQKGFIVTLGVKPLYPETGYGYIKTKKPMEMGFEVEKFVEKPDKNTAEKYIQDGSYYWNSGMFVGKISVFMEEFEKHASSIYKNSQEFDFSKSNNISPELYSKMESVSIDYAVMEKSDKIALLELKSDWSDVGSWQSLYDIKPKDNDGNVIAGHVIVDGVKDSLIYGGTKKLVAVSGLEDVVVVDTEDAVLVCKKENSQRVKNIYNKLKKENDVTHLVHKTVFRPWGYYTCIAEGDGYLTKVISVSSGQKLSTQSHNHRAEHWVVLQGTAKVLLGEEFLILEPGQSVDIGVAVVHSLQNPYDEELKIIEIQKGDYLSEDDIVRYEDIYGRV